MSGQKSSRVCARLGAVFGPVLLLLAGCSNVEKLVSDARNTLDEVMATDLTARHPAPAARRPPEAPFPQSQIYPGSNAEAEEAATAVQTDAVERGSDAFDLNFQNADIAAAAKVLLGDLLKVGYTVDARVQGTISLSSGRPVAKRDLLPLFESVLKLNGAELVKEGAIYKVVPTGEGQASGRVDRNARQRLEPGYGISVLPLRYVSGQTVLRAIDSFAAKPGMARVDNARNLLLVQGPSVERASAIEAALALDVDWMKNQSVGIFPVRNASPETIIAELQSVFDAGREGAAGGLVRFQPVNRLNAVLAVAQTGGMIDRVKTWIARLDRADYDNTTVRVYRVRYGNARVIAGILREVFIGQAGASQVGPPASGDLSQLTPGSTMQRMASVGTPSPTAATSSSQPTGLGTSAQPGGTTPTDTSGQSGTRTSGGVDLASLSTSTTGGPPLLPNVRITADVANNSLLIYANRDQYKIIERAIFELDRTPLQVAVDVTVAEVTLKNELEYGVQFYLKRLRDGQDKASIGLGATAVLKRLIPGANFVLGAEQDPRVVLSALNTITDVKVLSSPALVVLDNQQAVLQVGDEVPIATRSAQDVVAPNAPIINNIEMRNTGVILKVTPRVNANGVVNLDVIQEVSAVQPQPDARLTPTISQRRIQSSIAVASGQTVLLGGLISSRNDNSKSGIPALMDIKVLGDLFATNTKKAERTELIIFIRPQIIRNSIDAQLVAEELRSKLTVIGRGAPPPGGPQSAVPAAGR
jgi:general secretion pathway protein D